MSTKYMKATSAPGSETRNQQRYHSNTGHSIKDITRSFNNKEVSTHFIPIKEPLRSTLTDILSEACLTSPTLHMGAIHADKSN